MFSGPTATLTCTQSTVICLSWKLLSSTSKAKSPCCSVSIPAPPPPVHGWGLQCECACLPRATCAVCRGSGALAGTTRHRNPTGHQLPVGTGHWRSRSPRRRVARVLYGLWLAQGGHCRHCQRRAIPRPAGGSCRSQLGRGSRALALPGVSQPVRWISLNDHSSPVGATGRLSVS